MSRRLVRGLWLAGVTAWTLLLGLDISDQANPPALLTVAMAGLLLLLGNAAYRDSGLQRRGRSAE